MQVVRVGGYDVEKRWKVTRPLQIPATNGLGSYDAVIFLDDAGEPGSRNST